MSRPTVDDLAVWTPIMQEAALLYSRVENKHLIITCTDGFVLDVFWPKDRFMHLCGVARYRSFVVNRERGPVGFYRAALEVRLESDGMQFDDDRDDVKKKMRFIRQALDIKSGDIQLLVQGSYRRMTAFFGCEEWSIGVYEDKTCSEYSTSGERLQFLVHLPVEACVGSTFRIRDIGLRRFFQYRLSSSGSL